MHDPDAVAALVGLAMENAIAPLVAEVAALRKQLAAYEVRDLVAGPPGRDGDPGPPGPKGTDGDHGLGFDDLAVDFDGDRTLTLSFQRGDVRKAFPIALPFLRYQGVFAQGTAYAVGDVVTHGGSAWHCQGDTMRPPGDGGTDWKLMVKQGRDGRRNG